MQENKRRCQVMADNSVLLQSDVDAVEVEVLTAGQRLEQMRYSREAYREMLSLLTGKDLRQTKLIMPAEHEVSLSMESNRPELQRVVRSCRHRNAPSSLLRCRNLPSLRKDGMAIRD